MTSSNISFSLQPQFAPHPLASFHICNFPCVLSQHTFRLHGRAEILLGGRIVQLWKMYHGSNSERLSSHLQGKKLAQSYMLHVIWCSIWYVCFHILHTCAFLSELCSSIICWRFLVQHSCQSECGPDRCRVLRAVIPWAVPLQSCLSTWPQCLGCFQTTNWKCFLVSSWPRCLPSSSSCSSSTRRQSSGP